MQHKPMKNKYTAALFAFFFGWAGAHRFYLNQKGLGMMYLGATILGWMIPQLLILRAIPFMLGLIDGISLLFQNEEEFDYKYNQGERPEQRGRAQRNYRRTTRRSTGRNVPVEPDYRRRKPQDNRPKRQSRPSHKREQLKKSTVQKNNPFKLSGIKKFKEYDIEGAIEDFNRALGISPNDVSLHFNLACSYALNEDADKSYHHLSKAVSLGFNDFSKIKTHEALAFLRIHPQWDTFQTNGYKMTPQLDAPKEDNLLEDDQLLTQLNKLSELRKKGLISEAEFLIEKEKLMK
jgi:TM2 domain-containing membrane protein YozV